jgi:hypothetical protein
MDTRTPRSKAVVPVAIIAILAIILVGCGGAASGGAAWTLGPTAPATDSTNTSATAAPSGSSVPASSPSPAAAIPSGSSPKPFSGRMSREVRLVDGYLTMYMSLENTGTEPLTFLNTLYDTEPDQLYMPTVAFPFTNGATAAVTRAGRFFPSPAIVQPGDRAVYLMGGVAAKGTGQVAEPVANIKFCPTRGMDDIPGVPVEVRDLSWSTGNGVTTVRGMLAETKGSQRSSLPTVGIAFFDKADSFIGAIVGTRVGDRLEPNSTRPFEIEGRGVEADLITRAEAYAFMP